VKQWPLADNDVLYSGSSSSGIERGTERDGNKVCWCNRGGQLGIVPLCQVYAGASRIYRCQCSRVQPRILLLHLTVTGAVRVH